MKFTAGLPLRVFAACLAAAAAAQAAGAWLLNRAGALPYEALAEQLPALAGLTVLAAAAAAALAARGAGALAAAARRFAAGDFEQRVPQGLPGGLGEVAAAFNSMADRIGEQARESGLRALELEAAFREMPEALLVTDGSGNVLRMNTRARQLMGVKGFEPEGLRLSGLPGGGELSSAAIKALSSGREVRLEVSPAPGTVLEIAASPLVEAGRVGGCVLAARDVSGPRLLERQRRDFVANVSHELRTPLTAIKAGAETLLGGALSDPEHGPEFARTILGHAGRLERLVADLLTLSGAESGALKLEKEAVELRALAEEAAAGLAAACAARGVRFVNGAPAGLKVSADRHRLLQVLTNYLDNAAKYNREGGLVRLRAAAEGAYVRVTVDDDGPGVAPEHLPRLFERFYRADKARSRELGGTGLGLSIVKHLVELHGGAVGAESAPGRGSSFWFTLPL